MASRMFSNILLPSLSYHPFLSPVFLYLLHGLSFLLLSFSHHPISCVSSCVRYGNKEFWTRIDGTIAAKKMLLAKTFDSSLKKIPHKEVSVIFNTE